MLLCTPDMLVQSKSCKAPRQCSAEAPIAAPREMTVCSRLTMARPSKSAKAHCHWLPQLLIAALTVIVCLCSPFWVTCKNKARAWCQWLEQALMQLLSEMISDSNRCISIDSKSPKLSFHCLAFSHALKAALKTITLGDEQLCSTSRAATQRDARPWVLMAPVTCRPEGAGSMPLHQFDHISATSYGFKQVGGVL